MNQINLPKSQSKSDDNTKVASNPIPQTQTWEDDWGGSFGPPTSTPASAKLTPQERVEIIEKLYQEVLGRKPDTRDINYYKYSTLGEEEIRKQLITGKEHKALLEDGRDYKNMKERANQSETRVKILESQIRDQVDEFAQLTRLLNEKNLYIKQLREEKNNPYNFIDNSQPLVPEVEESPITKSEIKVETNEPADQVFVSPQPPSQSQPSTSSPTLLDRIKNVILPTA